jgi:hypothetical protein
VQVDDARSAIQELFALTPRCYGHCNETSRFEFVSNGWMIVQVCPDRYVSRIVGFGNEVNPEEFKKTLRAVAPGMEGVELADIRIASRYAWDLGLDRPNDDLIVRLAYWTQSYRRTKNDSPDREALFLCQNKDAFFTQPVSSKEKFCENCRGRV